MVTLWIVDIISVMFLISTQEFGGIVMILISRKLVICLKGFILKRVSNQQKKGNLCKYLKTYCLWFIITEHLIVSSSIFFKNSMSCPKKHMIYFLKELDVFRKESRARQDICDEIQTSISIIRDEQQTSIEKFISCKKNIKDNFGWIVTD